MPKVKHTSINPSSGDELGVSPNYPDRSNPNPQRPIEDIVSSRIKELPRRMSVEIDQSQPSNPSQPFIQLTRQIQKQSQQNGPPTAGGTRRLFRFRNIRTRPNWTLSSTLSRVSLRLCSLESQENLKTDSDRPPLGTLSCLWVEIVLRVSKNSMPTTFVTPFVFFFR